MLGRHKSDSNWFKEYWLMWKINRLGRCTKGFFSGLKISNLIFIYQHGKIIRDYFTFTSVTISLLLAVYCFLQESCFHKMKIMRKYSLCKYEESQNNDLLKASLLKTHQNFWISKCIFLFKESSFVGLYFILYKVLLPGSMWHEMKYTWIDFLFCASVSYLQSFSVLHIISHTLIGTVQCLDLWGLGGQRTNQLSTQPKLTGSRCIGKQNEIAFFFFFFFWNIFMAK